MRASQTVPNKIRINSAKKSMMGSKDSGSLSKHDLAYSGNFQTELADFSIKEKQLQGKVNRLEKQVSYYRQKHDESLIKVRFLTDKLQTLGAGDKIPAQINQEVGETDKNIEKLENLLNFKRSKQIKILKKKIKEFVQALQYQVGDEDMDQLTNQVEIIYFMKDLFFQKCKEIMAERSELDKVMQRLKEDTIFDRQKFQQQLNKVNQQNISLKDYVRTLEIQLINLRKQCQQKNKSSLKHFSINPFTQQNDANIQKLQLLNKELISQVEQVDLQLEQNQFTIATLKRNKQELEISLTSEKIKNRQLLKQLGKIRKNQEIWKERYRIIEQQKNQQFQTLQSEYKRLLQANERKRTIITQEDQVEQDSGEEKYQLAEGIQ